MVLFYLPRKIALANCYSSNVKKPKLKTVNNSLAVIVIFVCLYTLLLPLLPQFSYVTKSITNANELKKDTLNKTPQDNRLMIQKIGLNVAINEAQNISALNTGSWRRPNTSKPNENGNTVIVGHRFTYRGNDIFYHLDKIKEGDSIRVWWEGKAIDYKVESTKIVSAESVEIEDRTDDQRLTLYTCTPLWSAKDRLVVVAKPAGANQ